jgi:hypothetical protein
MSRIRSCSVQPFGVEIEFEAEEAIDWIFDPSADKKAKLVDLTTVRACCSFEGCR